MADTPTTPAPGSASALANTLKPTLLFAGGMVATFIVGLGIWSAVAPLSSAAIVSGFVSPDTSRKTIQHLEGGIIREMLVADGDVVEAGQPLLRLEPTLAQANFGARREQQLRLHIVKARLLAHLKDQREIVLPPELLPEIKGPLRDFHANQVEQFTARQQMLREREQILNQQILQLREEVRAKEIENASLVEQLGLIDTELASKRTLLNKKLVREPEYFAVLRTQSSTKARIGANKADISRAQQKIEEVRLQINTGRTQFQDQTTADLTKTNGDLAQLDEMMIATGDILKRTEVLAPVAGTVVNLRFKTIGGVVRPGEPILDVLPRDDDLIIDGRLTPVDKGAVRIGMTALVQLSSPDARHMPLLPAVVTHVSADSMPDQQTGQRFFVLKAKVARSDAERAASRGISFSSGLAADVFVVTGQRTVLQFALDPFLKSTRRAFVEK